jgi:nitrogen-specific signal transduction histidine kinase
MDNKELQFVETDDQEVVRLQSLVTEYENRHTQITGMIAKLRHEINNPLTGVIGQAQLLLRENLSEQSKQRVQTIERLAVRIRDTVSQLRTLETPAKPENTE